MGAVAIAVADANETLGQGTDYSYTITVAGGKISATAASPYGVAYALETLSQLITYQDAGTGFTMPPGPKYQLMISDAPRFGYRGLMISPGQRFMTPALLKTHLDGMEIARMNVLHFHLSEFCRFAIESQAFPELSANLSSGLNRGFYSRPTPPPPYPSPA